MKKRYIRIYIVICCKLDTVGLNDCVLAPTAGTHLHSNALPQVAGASVEEVQHRVRAEALPQVPHTVNVVQQFVGLVGLLLQLLHQLYNSRVLHFYLLNEVIVVLLQLVL